MKDEQRNISYIMVCKLWYGNNTYKSILDVAYVEIKMKKVFSFGLIKNVFSENLHHKIRLRGSFDIFRSLLLRQRYCLSLINILFSS